MGMHHPHENVYMNYEPHLEHHTTIHYLEELARQTFPNKRRQVTTYTSASPDTDVMQRVSGKCQLHDTCNSRGGTTLPSGTQSLTFGFVFNQYESTAER